LKAALKGWCFCDATDSMKNEMELLKRLSQMASRIVFNTFAVAGRSRCFHKEIILKEI
jgi:hypothetical protein